MTFDAVEMIMFRVAIVMLVDTATVQFKSPQESCIDEFVQRAIDGGATDVVMLPFPRKLFDELVGIKVLVATKDLLNQKTALLGFPQSPADQILFKTFAWRLRNLNCFKRRRLMIGGCGFSR